MVAATSVYIAYAVARANHASTVEARTVAIIVLLIIGLYVLVVLARPLTRYRKVLVLSMIGLSVGALTLAATRDLIDLRLPSDRLFWLAIGCGVGGCLAIALVNKLRGTRYVTGEDEDVGVDPRAGVDVDATAGPDAGPVTPSR